MALEASVEVSERGGNSVEVQGEHGGDMGSV